MNTKQDKILAVPTNVITGFLGVGKTSAISALLKLKPQNERWAILVNEFGEIGIDGSLFAGLNSDQTGIFVEQVPGGCMCCASGLPMQIALNQLLIKAEPHRLLIEPTGLGHPKEVLQLLSNPHYREVLDLQKTVTLVDARQIKDKRYTEHETFNQQLEVADIIVGNKTDLYSDDDKQNLIDYAPISNRGSKQIYFTTNGTLSLDWLAGPASYSQVKSCSHSDDHEHSHSHEHSHKHNHNHGHNHKHSHDESKLINEQEIPQGGFISAINEGEGYKSIGWRFSKERIFNYEKLKKFLNQVNSIRLKGVFVTEKGLFGYNSSADALQESSLNQCENSQMEIICDEINPSWQQSLLNAYFVASHPSKKTLS